MSDNYELARDWAGESIKALATGLGGSIFAVVGGFIGADRFERATTYWCFEHGVIHAPVGQSATIWGAPPGCKKALMMPVVGPVYSAEAAGLIIGAVIAVVALLLALAVMFANRKHAP